MRTQSAVKQYACVVRVPADDSDPAFHWRGGKGTRRTLIRDAVVAALRHAAADQGAFPAIRSRRPGALDLTIEGSPVGAETLSQLLPVLEVAAASEASVTTTRVGPLLVTAQWASPGAEKLDSRAPRVAQREQRGAKLRVVAKGSGDVEGRLRSFADRFVPKVTKQDIADLEAILRDAQAHTPRDTRKFADRVNSLLDVLSLRIQTDDGQIGRLRLNESGSLQITRASGGGRGFKNTSISLVGVERIRVGNRFTPPGSGRDR